MQSLGMWDCFEWEGERWRVIATSPQEDGEFVIQRLRDQRVERHSAAQLMSDTSFVPAPRSSDPSLGSLALLDQVPEAEAKRAVTIAECLSEAKRAGKTAAVIEAAREGLAAHGIELSARQTRRCWERFQREGVTGLVDQRLVRTGTRLARNQEVLALLEELAAAETNASTGTRSRMIRRARWAAQERGLELPTDRTIYRLLNDVDGGRSTFGMSTTRRSKAVRPDRTYKSTRPTRPGERVEIDSTPLDVMVLAPDGTRYRPELTYAIDVATNTICATMLRPVTATSVDIAALLLARMLTPVTNQPGWRGQLALARSVFGDDRFPDDRTWDEWASRRPVIIPETVVLDRGRVFTSTTFAAACENLQISQIFANPRQGTDKPHVEGGFRRIRDGFVQFLAGYTGGSVAFRGLDPAKDAVWTLDELQILLDLWVLTVWQTTPQSGLRVKGLEQRPLSPNEMFQACSATAPSRVRSLSQDEMLGLLPCKSRSIQPYGINFSNLVYDSDALHPYRGKKCPDTHDGLWRVRYDPYNMACLWVPQPGGGWIEARWTLAHMMDRPFSLEVLRAALRAVQTRDTDVQAIEILQEVNRIQTGRLQGPRERNASRTLASTPPLVTVGSDMSPEAPRSSDATPETGFDVASIPLLPRVD